jgi:small multidrug resistance pump
LLLDEIGFLLLAIVAEVVATNALKASNQFTKLLPSLPTVAIMASPFTS